MKHTVYFSNNGYKPNTRGDFIQIPLATLEEALLNVPEEVGFDIELSTSSPYYFPVKDCLRLPR